LAYSGIKVAVTVTNILNIALFLFFNYNPSVEKISGLSNNNANKVNNITKALVGYKHTKPEENSIKEILYI
jgi:hypothetical protein